MTEEEKKRQQGEEAAPVYAATYEQELRGLYDSMANREPFRYDPDEDALWNSYKDSYVQSGRLAMKDAMGQAAALTGGYGSTYSQGVGQERYDEYLRALTDRLPELYGISREAYDAEGDRMAEQYGMLGDLRDTEYGAYRDALADYRYGQEQAVKREQTEYDRQQDAYDSLLYMIKLSGYKPSEAELSESGMSRERADAAHEAWRMDNPQAAYLAGELTPEEYFALTGKWPAGYAPASSSGGGGGGGSSKKVSAYNVAASVINTLQKVGSNPQVMQNVITNTAQIKSSSTVSGLTTSQITKLEKMIKF